MWSAATFARRDRHHDARIVSRTWSGSIGSAVRNRSRVLASRSPPVRIRSRVLTSRPRPVMSGGWDPADGMGASLLPGTALAGPAQPAGWLLRVASFSQDKHG